MRKDFALTPEQRSDARRALQILSGSGLTLEDAAQRALSGNRATDRISVSDVIDRFLRSRLKAKVRPATYEWYEWRMKPFNDAFGERMIDDIQRPALFAWISSLQTGESNRAAIARAVRALFAWSIAQEPQLVTKDPSVGLATTAPGNGGEATILSVEDVETIMRNSGRFRSALALMFFAGVRPQEVAGKGKPPMLWSMVNTSERIIRIPTEIAKTGKPRALEELPEAVWRWLEPGKPNERICPARSREAIDCAKEALGRPWLKDVSRHCFASYALALTSNPGLVSTWTGHEGKPSLLYNNYRALRSKADAKRYFEITPRDSKTH